MLHPSQSTGLTPRAPGLCGTEQPVPGSGWFVLGVWSMPGLRREPRCGPRGWTDSQTPRSDRVSAGTGRPGVQRAANDNRAGNTGWENSTYVTALLPCTGDNCGKK